MLRRIGFRYLLPPLQLFLYCALCFCGYRDWQGQKPCTNWISSGRNFLAQNEEDFPLPPPCRRPNAWLVAGSLNAPAQLAGTIPAAILATALHREGDLWSFAISAPLVVLLWHWVGLWIDRRMGYVGLQKCRFRVPHLFVMVGFGYCVVTVFMSIIMLLHAPFSRGNRVQEFLVTICVACWSVFLLVVTSLNLRWRGALAKGKGSNPI